MKTVLLVHDEDARGNRLHSFRLPNSSATITVKDLIKNRIDFEIQRFNSQRPVCFYALVQPKGAELTSRGFRLKEHRELDSAEQFASAIKGFDKKSFLINANGQDYQKLDDQISLNDDTEIVFVKFMEVVGG